MIHSTILLLVLAILLVVLGIFGVIPSALAAALASIFIAIYLWALYTRIKFKPPPPKPPVPLNEKAAVVEELRPEGVVKVGGVYWRALCDGCEAKAGEAVVVVGYRDGALVVRRCSTQ
ncbi:MAG: NfeD family protein [Thermoproteus sp.]